MRAGLRYAAVAVIGFSLSGCAVEAQQSGSSSQPQQTAQAPAEPREVAVGAAQAQRLQAVLGPILAHMDNQLPASQIKLHVWDAPHINAANAGGGEFYVTTGLLQKANDTSSARSWRTRRRMPTSATSRSSRPWARGSRSARRCSSSSGRDRAW